LRFFISPAMGFYFDDTIESIQHNAAMHGFLEREV
jgi:hypothetical protein